jgi:hypothetical protein
MTCWWQEKLPGDSLKCEAAKKDQTWLCYLHLQVGMQGDDNEGEPVLLVKDIP